MLRAFCVEIYRKNAGPPGPHVDLHGPLFYSYRKNPSVWPHCLGNKQDLNVNETLASDLAGMEAAVFAADRGAEGKRAGAEDLPVVPLTQSVGARAFPGRIGLRLGSGGGRDRTGGPIDFGVGTVKSSGSSTIGVTVQGRRGHGAIGMGPAASGIGPSIMGCSGAIGMGGPTGGPGNIGACDMPAAASSISCWFCICCCCCIIRLVFSTNSSSCNTSRRPLARYCNARRPPPDMMARGMVSENTGSEMVTVCLKSCGNMHPYKLICYLGA